MSYRLDQGTGRCQYFIGVEDDGRHSLLSYSSVALSAMILECIARSLNAVVLERLMIQGECNTDDDDDTAITDTLKNTAVRNYEIPIFYHEFHQSIHYTAFRFNDNDNDTDSLAESEDTSFFSADADSTTMADCTSISSFPSMTDLHQPRRTLDKADGIATRCELTIQRVETHLLDTSPVSIVDLAQRKHTEHRYRERLLSNVSDGICAATEAFALLSTSSTLTHGMDQHTSLSSHTNNSNNASESNDNNHTHSSDPNQGSNENTHNHQHNSSDNIDDSSDDDSVSSFSPSNGLSTICETLSSRNIRIAVVGNVVSDSILLQHNVHTFLFLSFWFIHLANLSPCAIYRMPVRVLSLVHSPPPLLMMVEARLELQL